MLTKIFRLVKQYQADVVLAIAIVLITITSYNLGRIGAAGERKMPITIRPPGENPADIVRREVGQGTANAQTAIQRDQTVVASKKSKSKLYHFSWCPGAKQIAAANKISFPNEAAALAAGYILAGNCQK